MNCETYLSMLETLPVDELRYGDAATHAASCRDCDRVTRVVAERERNMILAFNEVHPPLGAGPIAARAVEISRRRRIASYYRIALSIAAVATIFFFIAVRRTVPASAVRVSQVFQLQCLSPDQAREMLRAVTSPDVSLSIGPNASLGIIRVGASPEEMMRIRAAMDRYDDPAQSQCDVRIVVPKAVPPKIQ